MAVGSKLRGGEVIELVSDMGGGKTALVRGLAAGMGSKDAVHSPSFTLSNVYKSDDLNLYHFDFHRLNDPGIMRDELAEILDDSKNVAAIEWAKIVEDVLPSDRLTIRIKPIGETSRELIFEYPEKLSYLIPDNT